ncbi:MAG: polyphosphate polymerase domain-containing protein [Oscillospiraceae bacterium]|nr:polyphosphate polymerase domain-containing protein [Oscillospiraceae bacterium]
MREKYDHLRYELKFLLSHYAAELVEKRLSAVMAHDRNADGRGGYFIRSLYFDDQQWTAYRDKLAGVEKRAKYRIRFYNHDDSFLSFEKKEKLRDMTRKTGVRIDRALAERMIANGDIAGREEDLLREFAALYRGGLRPRVLVDYDRTVFVHPLGNTRVTLDRAVRSAPYKTELFDPGLCTLPVLPEGQCVLEVKYDKIIPSFIPRLLEGIPKDRSSVSKYCRCLSIGE